MSSEGIAPSFEVTPNESLGPFYLSTPLNNIFRVLKENPTLYKGVECKFSEKAPLEADVAISITNLGILLRFDSLSQRLKYVEVYDLSKVRLTYNQETLSGSNVSPTFLHIHKLFGPTFPGENEETRQSYYLHYTGLSFLFSIPSKYQSLYNGLELPFEFPDGTTPLANRIVLYSGTNLRNPQLSRTVETKNYFFPVIIEHEKGLTIQKEGKSIVLYFGIHTQEVVGLLGSPESTFSKEGMKLRTQKDYFYNYFVLGLDILFDGELHKAKKFIMHGNFPTHPSFTQYWKCNWEMSIPKSDGVIGGAVTANSIWPDVSQMVGDVGQPLVHETGFSHTPYATVHYYGFKNIIFEVMRNGHIASVTIFKEDTLFASHLTVGEGTRH